MSHSSRVTPSLATAPARLRYARSFAVGSAFAVGWTPCIGPILGAVLTLAASSGTVVQGAFLLAAWSAGLGLPFLLAGLAVGTVMTAMRKLRPVMPALEILGGVLVILVGALIFLDRFTVFNSYFTGGVGLVTDGESAIEGFGITGPSGFLVAFAAGVIAFISPCCLPMVPAYLAHLVGVTNETSEGSARAGAFRHALAFVFGFSLVFVFLGASLGAVGYLVRDQLPTIQKVAGILLVIMGLNLTGAIRIPWLYRTYQIEFPSQDSVSGNCEPTSTVTAT